MRISDPMNVRADGERLIAFEVKVNETQIFHAQITCEAVLDMTSEDIANGGNEEGEMRRAIELVTKNANRRFTEAIYEKIEAGGIGDAGLPIFLNTLDFRSGAK
ncbi:MAG: hypothetical protein AB7P08_12850 [Burkholderiales bacterium]